MRKLLSVLLLAAMLIGLPQLGNFNTLSVCAQTAEVDENGYLIPSAASSENIRLLGTINQPENILDLDSETLCGSGFNSDVEQSVTVSYASVCAVGEVYICCKNEGTTTHTDGVTRGSYDLYVRHLGVWYKVASGVQARPEGVTVKLDGYYMADAVKAVITSWQGSKWACVADLAASPAGADLEAAGVDLDGKAVVREASYSGFADFGDTNIASNVLDGLNDTVCGGGYDQGVEQSITLTFANTVKLGRINIECKQEGAPSSGSWGSYDLYAICDGIPYKVAEGVEAWPEGRELVPDRGYNAQALKVVVTSWNGTAWAAVAELRVQGAGAGLSMAVRDANGKAVVSSYTENLTGDYEEINAVENMFDGNPNTMWGTNWTTSKEISVQLIFQDEVLVDGIEVYAMNENNAPASGAWGKYDLYAIVQGSEVLIQKGIEAWPQDYEGAPEGAGTVTFEEPIAAEGIKIVVCEWNVNEWAGIATLEISTALPKGDLNCDRAVSISDVTTLLNVIAGKSIIFDTDVTADFDNSGAVSISDVTKLLNVLAGKEVF